MNDVMMVKEAKKYNWIKVPVVITLVGILIVSVSCTLNKIPEADNQVNKTEGADSPSGAEETLVPTFIPPGYSSKMIHVKFREGTDIDPPEMTLPPELRNSVVKMARLFSQSDQELDKLGAGDLRLWFQITLAPGTDAVAFIEQLKSLDSVEIVEPAPLPAPPPQ